MTIAASPERGGVVHRAKDAELAHRAS